MSIARRLNRLVFRKGRVFAERWHERALTTPHAVRDCIVYVLGNCKKHGEAAVIIDPYSSAPHFRFFAECHGKTPIELSPDFEPAALGVRGSAVEAPNTWLLQHGWLRHGPLSIYEQPRH